MNDIPGSGHNLASPLDLIRERIESDILPACDEWNAIDEIRDEDTARRCDDMLSKLTAELRALAAAEKTEKQPHRDKLNVIGLAYSAAMLPLQTAKSLIEPKMRRWLQRREDEVRAEKARKIAEAERLAREAAVATAKAGPTVESNIRALEAAERAHEAARLAAQPVARAQVRGQYSHRARSLRTTWAAEVVDVLQAFVYYQDHPDVREVLTKLGSAEARAGARDIPGYRVFEREIAA